MFRTPRLHWVRANGRDIYELSEKDLQITRNPPKSYICGFGILEDEPIQSCNVYVGIMHFSIKVCYRIACCRMLVVTCTKDVIVFLSFLCSRTMHDYFIRGCRECRKYSKKQELSFVSLFLTHRQSGTIIVDWDNIKGSLCIYRHWYHWIKNIAQRMDFMTYYIF